MTKKAENYLYLVWLISFIITFTFSILIDMKDYNYNNYSWYQYIFIYPQILMISSSYIALSEKTLLAAYMALTISIIGCFISLYYHVYQKLIFLHNMGESLEWSNYFMIPTLLSIPFALIINFNILLIIDKRKEI